METADRELSKRKERGRKKTMEKEIMVGDDNEAKKIITTKCNLTLIW